MPQPFTTAELWELPGVREIVLRAVWREHPNLRDQGVSLADRGDRIAALAAQVCTAPEAEHAPDTRERLADQAVRELARSRWAKLVHLAARRIARRTKLPKNASEAINDGAALRNELDAVGLVPQKLVDDTVFTMVWAATLLAEIAGNLNESGKPAAEWLESAFPDPDFPPELRRRTEEVRAILGRLLAVWAEESDVDLRGGGDAKQPHYSVGEPRPGELPHVAVEVAIDAASLEVLAAKVEPIAGEVWTWNEPAKRIEVKRLSGGRYEARERSELLSGVDLALLASFVLPGESHTALAKKYRAALSRDG